MIEHDELLLRLEPELGTEKINSLKLIHALGNDERKQRIEKIINISARTLLKDSLLDNQVLLPPSSRADCEGSGDIFLGDVAYGKDRNNKDRILYPLNLNLEDIKNHMIVTGLSGVGKTTLAYNLLIELAKKGTSCIVFDWDRTWRNFISLDYGFCKDIQIYTIGRNDIKPFSWNMFFSPPPNIKFSSWLGIASSKPLQKSLLSGQGVEDYLENISEELMTDYEKGLLRMLPNLEDIKNRIKNKFAKARQLLWKQSAERVLKDLTRDSIKDVFGSREPIDISKEILEKKGITIIEMDIETPEHLRVLFQELLLTYFMLYYLHKGEAEKEEIRTAVFLEEFPNMLPKSNIEKQVGSDIIKTMFKEGRKFGLGLIAIAQETSELPNYVLANCKIQAHFACQTKKDIEATASGLFLKQHEIPFLDLIWRGEAIVKVKGRVRNCLVKIPPPPAFRKVTDDELIKWQQKN